MLKRSILLLAIVATLSWTRAQAIEQWISQRDPNLGFSFSYPEPVFSSVPGDDKPSFHYFASDTWDAKFLVGAWDNRSGTTPEHFKQWMIANAGGYEDVTYQPHGRSWFVLSGYRGDLIYYEKAMFSCGSHVVNIMAIAYPTAQAECLIQLANGWRTVSGPVGSAVRPKNNPCARASTWLGAKVTKTMHRVPRQMTAVPSPSAERAFFQKVCPKSL